MTNYFIAGLLTSLFVFFSYEQNEITGTAHIPCLLVLLTSLAFLIIPLLKKQPPVLRKLCFADCAFYLFFFIITVVCPLWNCLPESGYRTSPRPSFNQHSVWIFGFALWFLLRQTLPNEKMITGIFKVLLAVFFSLTLLGLYQQFVDIPRMKHEFNADPAATIRKIAPSAEVGTPSFDRLSDRIRTAVPMGTYPLSNTFGGILAVGAIAAFGFFVSRIEKNTEEVKRTFFVWIKFVYTHGLYFLLTLLLLLVFNVVKCRSAGIAVLVGIVSVAFCFGLKSSLTVRKPQRKIIGVIIIFIILCLTPFLFPSQGKSIVAGAKQSLGYRLEYWTASLGIIRDYPLTGCGSGNFKQTYTKYKLPHSSEEISDPHNFAVEIAAVAGIPALLAFLFAIGSVFYCARKHKDAEEKEDNSSCPPYLCAQNNYLFYYGGLTGCWAAYLISFLTEVPMDFAAPAAATVAFPLTALAINNFRAATGGLRTSLFAILTLVLLIHLSAAGGISVINTLSLLLFFCAVIAAREGNEPEETKNVLRRTYRAIFALSIAVIFVYFLGFKPVLTSFSYTTQAADEFNLNRKIELLEEAASADEFSAAIQEQLTQSYYFLWSQQNYNNAELEEKVFRNQEKVFSRMQRSATLRFAAAERMNFAFHQTADAEKRKKYLEKALQWYREAVERYPNYAPFRAPFALLLEEAGEKKEALKERDKALQLDDLMPHKDQKLTPEQRGGRI